MPNNSNTSGIANGSSFYTGGSPKWDPKFRLPGSTNRAINGNNNDLSQGPIGDYTYNSIDRITCNDFSISLANKNATVIKGNKEFIFEFDKLTSLDLNSNLMTVKTVDRTPFFLTFTTVEECIHAEERLYLAINQGFDNNCLCNC